VGFRHEQARGDRDEHINVNIDKVPAAYLNQYTKQEDFQPDYYGVKYDLYSVMHYGSENGIIKSLDKYRNFLMGQRIGLSFLDKQLANMAYKCNGLSFSFIIHENVVR
jgi:hypothetical protein